jgi:hypothetical protein
VPFTMNTVEGTEASLFVAGHAQGRSRGGGRWACRATGLVGPRTRKALAVALRERTDGVPLLGTHQRPSGPTGPLGMVRRATGAAWPAYVGVILETSEALLYSFAVASSKFAILPAIVGAGVGFAWPWSVLPLIRKLTSHGLLHMVGVCG